MSPAEDPKLLAQQLRAVEQHEGFLAFLSCGLRIGSAEWKREALGLFALHPETVMIGGNIQSAEGKIAAADLAFDFSDVCGGPNSSRGTNDPGYFGQMWKQRSVDAVSTRFAVMRLEFFFELAAQLPAGTSLAFMGMWAGAYAAQTSRRVVYSPFLSGVSDLPANRCANAEEEALFRQLNQHLLPSGRFYSRVFSEERAFVLRDPGLV
jgi:hypothetical protein